MSKHIYTWLALGDSYTIGEGVPLHESFPYQAVQLLRRKGLGFHPPEIIAKTGWTTFELVEHILHIQLNEQYDFVTLLIGVNNQYRGLSGDDYTSDFEFLLRKAVHFAGGKANHVFVLSIPDWGVTPFAKNRNIKMISAEIDAFNKINKHIAAKYSVHYIDITESTRRASSDISLLTADHLHYSGKEHAVWATLVADAIKKQS